MLTIKVKKGFYDVQDNCWRAADSVFEATEERFEELESRLPDFVEQASDKKGKKAAKNEEVASDELPI